jgi:hypothetical protein
VKPRHQGHALVIVLVVMLVVQLTAWGFLMWVNAEQRLAGGATRSLAAFYLAEAGLQKALWQLEEGRFGEAVPGGWFAPREEAMGAGTFAVDEFEYLSDGVLSIVVRGDVGRVRRRLKGLVRVGPQPLAYGVYARGSIVFDGSARTYVLSPRSARSGCRRGGDLAAGGEVRFDSPSVALNSFRGRDLSLREGIIPDRALLGAGSPDPDLGLVDVVLAGNAELKSGKSRTLVDLAELRQQVGELGIRRVRVREAIPALSIAMDRYRGLAEANTANAPLNAAAGWTSARASLRAKAHSRYSEGEFEAILGYLRDHPGRTLRGLVFVEGDVELGEGASLIIPDGALVVAGDIALKDGARLQVRHGPNTRALPGIIAGGEAIIEIAKEAAVTVDGLVLAGSRVDVLGGTLDVVGAVATGSFVNKDGIVTVRYDPEVLVTTGLRRTAKGAAELVSWQELH